MLAHRTGAAVAAILCAASATAWAQTLPGYDLGAPRLDTVPNARQDQGQRPQQARRPVFQLLLSAEETFTTNVLLQPDGRSDLVTRIIPEVRIAERGARITVDGNVAAPFLLYARTGAENNRIVPRVDLTGNVEAIERFFFVEGDVHVYENYLSPFGAISIAPENNPQNAYTSQSYRLSPYIKGQSRGDYSYELRDDNIWTGLGNAPVNTRNAYTNEVTGKLTRNPTPVGWGLEYQRANVQFSSEPGQVTEIARLRALYRPHPEIELALIGGYEHDRYPGREIRDGIYGGSVQWRPSDRTKVDASWEHRFFGSSYNMLASTRTPLTVWTVTAARDVTSYPQVLAQLGAGQQVSGLLDNIFASRIPDPAERQAFVDQLIADRGLPSILTSAVTLFTRNIYVQERIEATVGLLGANNTVFLNAFHVRTQPVPGTETIGGDPLEALLNNNTQNGGGAVWTHKLMPKVTLTASAEYQHTVANGHEAGAANRLATQATLSTPLSPATSLHGGVRFQRLRSDVNNDFDEFAVFVGVTHLFH